MVLPLLPIFHILLSASASSSCSAAGTHPRWASELQQLSPSSLVQLLTTSEARLQRLQFLAELQRQDKWSLYTAATGLPEARFLSQFPKYTAWAAARKQQQQAQQDKAAGHA